MDTSRWPSRVCDDPLYPTRSSRRKVPSLATAAGLAVLLAAAPAGAASNPGTGDPGFFTFRPSSAVGGTQINVASGNALIRTRDLASAVANYNVVVDRAYNSLAPDAFSILSPRWSFDVGPTNGLAVESNQDVTVAGPSGYRIRFARQSDGRYTAPAGFDGSLTKTSSGWTLVRTSQNDQFGYDNNGQLAWTKDAAARDFTVQGTSAAGRTVLSSYGTSSGRRVNLSYTGDSLVREMDDPSSGHHYYRYTSGRLSQYEAPGGATTGYRYNSSGRLDKITESGGTTVELETTPAGRVQSMTATLPGGVPQTTRFVYERRPYKTDVTGPDGVRRTYAYDDEWRVTRQYNPDVKPTVTVAGELRDLAGGYVGPNRTYPLVVTAEGADGAGLRRLSTERENGSEIAGADVPCATAAFDTVCPTRYSSSLDVDFSTVPEGQQTIRGAATDDEQNRGTSGTWNVLVDKSPPSAASDFQLSSFDPSDPDASATITWRMPEDPNLPGDLPGSGVASTEARYRLGSGEWSAWSSSADEVSDDEEGNPVGDGDLVVAGGSSGDVVSVEVRATDAVGNVAIAAGGSVRLAEQLEDPALEEIAIDSFVSDYATSRDVARSWLRVQGKAAGLGLDVRDVVPSGTYGGLWYDNANRRVKIGLTSSAGATSAREQARSRGVEATTDIVTVAHTVSQLEQAQPAILDALSDLDGQGLYTLSRNTAANRLEIDVAASATNAQQSLIDSVAANAAVTTTVIASPKSRLTTKKQACKLPYCDAPLRGGVGLDVQAGRICTTGFFARTQGSRAPRILTAGHCLLGKYAGDVLYTSTASQKTRRRIGTAASGAIDGRGGDAGAVIIDSSSPFRSTRNRRPVVFVTKATVGTTRRETNYAIRKVLLSDPGDRICVTGSTNGTRCGEITRVGQKVEDTEGVVNLGMGEAKICGTTDGDSGGPMYDNHAAYGVLSSGPDTENNPQDTSCIVSYEGAMRLQQTTGSSIALRK